MIVLEQKNPLKYTGLPADMELGQNEGRTAFAEDPDHPIFYGLKQKDLFTWGSDEVVYRNAYQKPTRGGKSLIQCDMRLTGHGPCGSACGQGFDSGQSTAHRRKTAGQCHCAAAPRQPARVRSQLQTDVPARCRGCRSGDALFARTLDAINLNYTKAE